MIRLTAQQIENLPEWMTIPDYQSYEVNCRAGLVRNTEKGKILKPNHSSYHYPKVTLCKDRRHYDKNVHRIVALAAFGYYGISIDGLCVCHLDEERHDPRVANLALGSYKENMNFEKARKRLSEAARGEKNHLFGKHHSEATRKKMSVANKGKRHSEESRRKISEAQPKKAVAAYKDGVLTLIFNSMALTKVYGFNKGTVCNCCKGKQKQHKGYEWRYFNTTY